MGDSEREAALRARLLRARERAEPAAGDTKRGSSRPPPPPPPLQPTGSGSAAATATGAHEQRATGSEAELNDEQWEAIQPLFFGRNGFYRADAAVEAQSFRAFHAKYVRRVGSRGGGGGGGGGSSSAQAAPSSEAPAASSSADLGLPKRFDPRYRVNHAILASGGTATDPLNLRELPAEVARRLQRAGLGEAAIKEVRAQLQLFEDFQQASPNPNPNPNPNANPNASPNPNPNPDQAPDPTATAAASSRTRPRSRRRARARS